MQPYNGWTNKLTWNVAVWDTLEGYESPLLEEHTQALDEWSDDGSHPEDKPERPTRYAIGREIEEWFMETFADEIPTEGLIADILTDALAWIEWPELADAVIEAFEYDQAHR